jgi:hypothetical protein
MNALFTVEGLPELDARLDKIAVMVANPITREAPAGLRQSHQGPGGRAGGQKTGTLAKDTWSWPACGRIPRQADQDKNMCW